MDRVFGAQDYPFPAWESSTGLGLAVATLDSGIDQTHADLAAAGGTNTIDGTSWGSDGSGHGTHVAGTVAALDNAAGVVGVVPKVSLYAVKVLNDSGNGTVSSVVSGIQWAVNRGIPVLNMSLGSSSHSQTLQDACDAACNAGHLLVAAAGNSGNPPGKGDNVSYPARYSSVIAVAASDQSDSRAGFSSTGPAVELIAPGVEILSTVPGGGYGIKSGTSMASPHAAGAAALAWAANPSLTNTQIREILRQTAQNLGLPGNHQGYGLVRADLAVTAALAAQPPVSWTVSGTVSDADTGAAIAGATVTIAQTGQSASTDGGGFYEITAVPEGTYDIIASKEGYAAETRPNVAVTGSTVVDFALTPVTDTPGEALVVNVTTDKAAYSWNSWVSITVTVLSQDRAAVEGAGVTVTVISPDGGITKSEGATDSSGKAYFRYRVPNKAAKGTYTVTAEASKGGVSGGGGTEFTVQ